MTAFPDREIDPVTGFQIDKETGHFVGIVPAPIKSGIVTEYPKWIEPHISHVDLTGDGRHIVGDHENDWDRWGNHKILVHDEDDELKMTSEKTKENPEAIEHEASVLAPDETLKKDVA
jgi:hypothetical protein